jgi:hypothetical protein
MRDNFDSQMTDEQLELEMEHREKLALTWGICVIVGLFVETLAAAIISSQHHSGMPSGHFGFIRSGKFWRVLSDVLIAIGVFGEIWWNHQASKIREELRQRAHNRVASAEQETERLRSQAAWRDLSREQVTAIAQV